MEPNIYPQPLQWNRKLKLGKCRRISIHDPYGKWKTKEIPTQNQQGQIMVDLYLAVCPEGFERSKHQMIREEGYYIEIQEKGSNRAVAWISAISERGYHYAYLTWKQLIEHPLYEGFILDRPLMKIRGIVEGYYGKPWSQEERGRALSVLAAEKMNTYIYAPKDDPYHREAWRTPYPEAEVKKLDWLIETCHDHYIDFVFAVSPGLSIQYSSTEHLDLLMGKFKQVYSMGARFFGLFLDDIPSKIIHDTDQSKYETIQNAHVDFIHAVFSRLKEWNVSNQLIVCPTVYFGRGDERYIMELGQSLHEDIAIMWTGRSICSPEIELREARVFYELTAHRPLYWDNYPVNDANMRDEIHIGPLIRRDRQLYLHSIGLISNVMEYAEASLIPLITSAHYGWNTLSYSPEDSFEYAVKMIVGEAAVSSFIPISDSINQSSLSPLPGDRFMQIWFEHSAKWDTDPNAKSHFEHVLKEYLADIEKLLQMENLKIKKELSPWLKQLQEDLEFLIKIITSSIDDKEVLEIMNERYTNKVKALGFFPYLIGNEILNKNRLTSK